MSTGDRESWGADSPRASVGEAAALITVAPIASAATRHEDERARAAKEAAELEKQEAKRRARAAAASQLQESAGRELRLIALATVVLFACVVAGSYFLTFNPDGPGGRGKLALGAVWHYAGLALIIGSVVAFATGIVFDRAQQASGRGAWSTGTMAVHPALALAAAVVAFGAGVHRGYVTPGAWTYIAGAASVGFIASLLARYLVAGEKSTTLRRLAGVALLVGTGATIWLVVPSNGLSSARAQARDAAKLKRAIPMSGCTSPGVSAVDTTLLRDSLRALIRCQSSGVTGFYFAFRNRTLLDLYVAQRKTRVGALGHTDARNCAKASGTFINTWHDTKDRSVDLGEILCYGSGGNSRVESSDTRTLTYEVFNGLDRASLYQWWSRHLVGRSFRGA